MYRDLALMLALCASPAAAETLADMAGPWSGTGTARETPTSPEETVRCRIDNTWQADRARLKVAGRCAVPGRSFDIDGTLVLGEDGKVSGFWSNPDGPGQTAISGKAQGDAVYFTFRAKSPATGQDLSQIVTLSLKGDQLRLGTVTRDERIAIADILFAR